MVVENKKARFNYEYIEKFVAGIILVGTEIKSIKENGCTLVDSFCYFDNGELYIKEMQISKYKFGNSFNHEPKRDRKLLLKRKELLSLEKKSKEKGLTIVVDNVFINNKGLLKVEIYLAKGKNNFDKRQTLKKKDIERELKNL